MVCHFIRFIPNRAAMDTDMAHYALMNSENVSSNIGDLSPNKQNQRKMSEVLNNGVLPQDEKILAFKQKAPENGGDYLIHSHYGGDYYRFRDIRY